MNDPPIDLSRDTVGFYDAIAESYDAQVLRYPDVSDEYVARICALMPEGRRCLDVACGTGNWIPMLCERFGEVIGIDASPAMLRIARSKCGYATQSKFLQLDILSFPSVPEVDFVFGAFWLSHVPRELFRSFWMWLGKRVHSHGSVVFIDSRRRGPGGDGAMRQAPDGRVFNIVKEDWTAKELISAVKTVGWDGQVESISAHVYALSAKRRAMQFCAGTHL